DMPGADRDGLTAGPADRLQAVGGAIVALDSGLGHMSEARAVDNSLFMKVIYLSILGASTFLALGMIRRAVGKQEGNKNVLS
ncbi:hypothetical protein, partial [Collinsella sp. HCP3S3_E5]|uniref:hypothetical protein n=1 Tax=Collinsella sp. HCP3S3_E5 TaxID=3438936 RepID=UPI003F89179A